MGAHTVVGSASSNRGVRAVFNVHHGVVGRTSSLYYSGVYKKNGGSPVATQRAFPFALRLVDGRLFLIRKRFIIGYQTLDKQDKLWKL